MATAQMCELPLLCLCCFLGLLLEGCGGRDFRDVESCILQVYEEESGLSGEGSGLSGESCQERDKCKKLGEKCETLELKCACDFSEQMAAFVGIEERAKHCCAGGDKECFKFIHTFTKHHQDQHSEMVRACRWADGLLSTLQSWELPDNFALRDPTAHSALGGGLRAPGLQVGACCLFVVTAALTLRQSLRSNAGGSSPALIDEEASSE